MPNTMVPRHARLAAIFLGATVLAGSQAAADQVIPDDLIVQLSLCVGFDCVNNEDFQFSTIRLKEQNLRIDFMDTSTGAFPTRDWRLEANSSASGGSNHFAIKDMGNASTGAEGGTALLTVTAGAPANSIFVSSTGRVGFRTSTPVLDLHVRSGNTPAIRFEQDGSSGFTPQTWDIAGNEAGFFIRDATGGSTLPFRIRPGAPSSSIAIAPGGTVGIGTLNPQDRLHVLGSGNPSIRIETTGASLAKWSLQTLDASGLFAVRDVVTGNIPFRINPGAPNLAFEIRNNGAIRMSQLVNCAGIQTNANGLLSCAASPSPPPGGKTSVTPTTVRGASIANAAASSSPVGPGAGASAGSSAARDSEAASESCAPGDMAGRWKLIGTNIVKFGANSVLWCDVQLTEAQDRSKMSYSIAGKCRSHLPDDSTPEEFTVDGKNSIVETATCTMSGSFKIKQGSATVATANILEGWIEGPVNRKSRATALSRMPHGRTSAIQTFVLQR